MNKTLLIEGMSCGHCVKAVESALLAVPGVAEAKVDLAAKTATVALNGDVADSVLSAAVDDAGYEVVEVR